MNTTPPVHRNTEQYLQQLIENKKEINNVILVEGPRQVGKTTLVRSTLKFLKYSYREFNLEADPTLAAKMDQCANFAEFTDLVRHTMGIPADGSELLFIDEAQESKQLGSFVRFMKEEWKNQLVILSGSSMARIFRDSRYPVGRVQPIRVQPFSFTEFVRASPDHELNKRLAVTALDLKLTDTLHAHCLDLLEQYLDVGGLPEVVVSYFNREAWQKRREELIYGYYQDFQRVFGEQRQSYLVAVLKTVAHLLGSSFKNSHVAALLDGGNNAKIIEAISQLEAWQMLVSVEQRGPTPEKHFLPKRYLFDIGIARELRESAWPHITLLATSDPAQRKPLGGVIENVVANILIGYEHKEYKLSGWKKSSSGSEVDFIIKRHDHTIPVECKAALTIKNTHLNGVCDFMNHFKSSLGIVISLAPLELRTLPNKKRILIVPLYLAEYLFPLLDGI